MLILGKSAGMLTQQARTGDLSLNEWMVGYLLHSEALAPSELRLFRPSVCNRLDRNTSGLVLCGKSLPGSQALSELIRSRALRKFYRTLCVGRLGADVPGTATEVELITGKTHQIRAHLASMGHPLVGDCKYGDARINHIFLQKFGLAWQLLHACRLEFPSLEETALTTLSGRIIQAPLPEYYEAIVGELDNPGTWEF